MTDTAVTSVEVERWKPFAGSLLLHFLLIGVALAGWRWWERAAPRAPVQLPIEGRVVYEMPAPRREPRAAPSPPMPEPAEVERRAEAARAALLAEEGVRRERAQRAQEIQADRERQERERAARI
ncbi:MAG: hypothetical protein NZM12_05795, partial [Steroidobacteraceae bacterium]|nr:hypothetical protein [Steroidobacteraceae bacterium]